MRKKTKSVLAALMLAIGSSETFAATIANWTFETSQPAGTGIALGNVQGETGGSDALAESDHVASATTYSTPAGNGSNHSFSSNNWAVGDFYMFEVDFTLIPTGETQFNISWSQAGSSTGPANFKLQYSSGGITYHDVNSYNVILSNFNPNSINAAATYAVNLPAFDVAPELLVIRLTDNSTTSIGGGTVASTGTDRVDDVVVGNGLLPEPISLGLLGFAGLALWRPPLRSGAKRSG